MPQPIGFSSLLIAPVAVLLTCAPAFGQWLGAPEGNAPRLGNGEVDLEAPPPRHANGRVDLQGVWMADDNRYIRDLALDIGDDQVPYQPWARRLFDERQDGSHSGELSRPPLPEEAQVLENLYENSEGDEREKWTRVARVLLNVDEFVTRE